jgi:hypothetical protein
MPRREAEHQGRGNGWGYEMERPANYQSLLTSHLSPLTSHVSQYLLLVSNVLYFSIMERRAGHG